MDEKDTNVRKQWLGLLLFNIALSALSNFLEFKFNPKLDQVPQMKMVYLISLGAALGIAYLFYYCAYKKPGTKFLFLSLVVTGISLVANPILYFSGKLAASNYIPYYGYYFILSELVGIWWVVLCWKMIKINKRLKVL